MQQHYGVQRVQTHSSRTRDVMATNMGQDDGVKTCFKTCGYECRKIYRMELLILHYCDLLASKWCRLLLWTIQTLISTQFDLMCCWLLIRDFNKTYLNINYVVLSLIYGHNQCSGSLKLQSIYNIYTHTYTRTYAHTKHPYSVHQLKDLYISLYIHIYMGRRKIKNH